MVEIGCANNYLGNGASTETVTVTTTIAQTYFVRIVKAGAAGSSMLGTICAFSLPPLANDDCATAETIACGQTINGTTVGATNEAVPAACYGNNIAPSVWYTFTGDGSNVLLSLCVGTTFDTQLAIFTGTCAALQCYGFNDDGCGLQSQAAFTTIPGVVYFVRVFGYFGASGPFQLTMTCTVPVVPNEGCGGAINLACPQTVTGTTVGAIQDVIPNGCFVDNFAPGVWYKFTGDGTNITLSLCGSAYDTQISILTGSCYNFTCTNYNDQFCGDQSQITVTTTLGTVYYVYVFGFFGDSGAFTLNIACAPVPPSPCLDLEPNGCAAINLGPDIVIPTCTDPCTPITLTANYFEVGTTSSYAVCNIPYAPYPYNTGTGFSIGVDDIYTGLINLPFNFCFFGANYSQCVVGANGVISFNPAYASGPCPWAFSALCPNAALPLNAIFGVYHDMDPSIYCGATPCGDARYATFGVAPCRVFVVSYDNVPHFSFACNSLRTSCEIVLYETTNVIEVFIESKPICATWNGGRALVGIQNSAGNLGFTPATRNTGVWTTTNEGWRFIPNGPSSVLIEWFSQGNPLGTGTTVSVCPMLPTQTYAATATYSRCDGTTVVVSDAVVVQCTQLVVPVEWKSFDAILSHDQKTVECKWVTATETNNEYFTIERSPDGEYWQDLGQIPGSISSNSEKAYSWIDRNPLSGVGYYRIQQTDFNGNHLLSEIRSVNRPYGTNIAVYPNPAKDKLTISPWKNTYLPRFIEPSGRIIECNYSESGIVDVVSLKDGLYILEVIDKISGEIQRQTVIIAH